MNTVEREHEPARAIGEIFANKAMLRTYVAAFVAIVSGALSVTISDAMIDSITLVAMFAAMAWGPIAAQLDHRKIAKAQAEETRDAVYSPATVKEIAREAAATRSPDVPEPPAT